MLHKATHFQPTSCKPPLSTKEKIEDRGPAKSQETRPLAELSLNILFSTIYGKEVI
jgi:hypothetical protein